MSNIYFRRVIVDNFGQGKRKRPSISAIFYDSADPHTDIRYNLNAVKNAIIDRKQRKLHVEGLEYGHDRLLEKYKELGIKPQESRKNKRRRQQALARG
jgi:hypothetical protein